MGGVDFDPNRTCKSDITSCRLNVLHTLKKKKKKKKKRKKVKFYCDFLEVDILLSLLLLALVVINLIYQCGF